MAGCCDPSGYPGAFNPKTARRSARAFERRGLDSTAGPMVAALAEHGVAGSSILEVGAGSGSALVALLTAGADHATGVDISPNYQEVAANLLTDRGFDSFEWHTGDFVALSDELQNSDVVFLNRVVCCYPNMEDMVDSATSKSNRLVAMSYPRRRVLTRWFMKATNAWLRLNRNSFRVFLHDPGAVAARVERNGFVEVEAGRTPAWHWKVWQRSS